MEDLKFNPESGGSNKAPLGEVINTTALLAEIHHIVKDHLESTQFSNLPSGGSATDFWFSKDVEIKDEVALSIFDRFEKDLIKGDMTLLDKLGTYLFEKLILLGNTVETKYLEIQDYDHRKLTALQGLTISAIGSIFVLGAIGEILNMPELCVGIPVVLAVIPSLVFLHYLGERKVELKSLNQIES